jgi:hypothetical protein
MMPAAMETLNRVFYRNLAKTVNSENMTLDDVLYLTVLWEAKMFQQLRRHEFSGFIQSYNDVLNEFWLYLSFSDDISLEDVYNEYSLDGGTERLLWLPNDKREFLYSQYKELNFNIGRIRG